MTVKYYDAKILGDAKQKAERRYRNILANSGKVMESGETRDVDNLYVMGTEGKLVKIASLAQNPDKQKETYTVNFATNHGHNDPVTGERVVNVEDIIGDAKVWLEEDGLHARVYFANDDEKADHAWAVSDNASYSIGMEYWEYGYYGAEENIDGYVGILREISMVDTGNDPRAKTIDTKASKGATGAANDGETTNLKKGKSMGKKIDELTQDEARAMARELSEVLDRFTADVPESETEPTARDTKDAEGEAAEEKAEEKTEAPAEKAETTDNVKHMPVIVIKDKAAKQEKAMKKTDWLYSKDAKNAWAKALKQAGTFGGHFDALWSAEVRKHMTTDDITGLPLPVPVEQIFESVLEESDGIISHFRAINSKSFRVNLLSAVDDEGGRAKGHKKGDVKQDQNLQNAYRDLLVKMVYKRLPLDATELYENPELIEFRARELVEAILLEIERAAIIGDGRTSPSGSNPDLRLFDGTRGFYSIKADAAASSGVGTMLATTVAATVGTNFYDKVVAARGQIKTEGRQFIVAKSSVVTGLLTARVNGTTGDYLMTPGAGTVENLLNVSRVYTPAWMETDTDNNAYLIVDNAYGMIGERGIRTRGDFDTSTNQDILLAETPRGGSLIRKYSAVAIAASA